MTTKETVTSIEQFFERIRNLFDKNRHAEFTFLKAQVETLLEVVGDRRILLSNEQRARLAKAGMDVKDRLPELSLIFKPATILKWHRALKAAKWNFAQRRKETPGRPPVRPETEAIVLKLARENSWGYRRITGELEKLGRPLAASTVRNILKKHGLPPSPERNDTSWKQFIQRHLDSTWAADFFTEEVWCLGGLATFYILFFIHHKTRRIRIAGATQNPNAAWVTQQARNFCMLHEPGENKIRFFLHDRDCSFLPFDAVLKTEGIRILKTPFQAPNANAYAERFVRESRETLDQLILVGESHLRRVLNQIEEYHNTCRPHQGIENKVPLGYTYPDGPAPPEAIRRKSFIGGLLNHYYVDPAA